MNNIKMRLTGSGGQGLILAGIIMAEAAILDGNNAVQTQSYGPEARGGASKAEVIISGSDIDFPKVEIPNILLCLTQLSLTKYGHELEGDGFLVIDDSLELDESEINCKVVKAPILSTASQELKSPIVANIVAIGLLSEITGAISKESLLECILSRVPKGTEELNTKALERGMELGRTCKATGGCNIESDMPLEDRIKYFYSKLSKNQIALADYIMKNSADILFLKAYNLGKAVGVSASTVGRFAQFIGYDDYKHLQKSLAKNFKNKLSSFERYKSSRESAINPHEIEEIVETDIMNIKRSLELNDFGKFESICDSILSAEKVYIIGRRSSKILADYLGFYLNFMRSGVMIVPAGAGELMDELIHVTEKDVVVAFSFPRYAKMTYDALDFVRDRGAKIIGMTDAFHSPMMDYADEVLVAEFGMSTFIDSMTAPLSVLNALILYLSKHKKSEMGSSLSLLEEMWQKYNIYQK